MLATLPASAAAGRRWRRTAECNPSSDKYVEEVAAAEPAQRFSHEADGVPQQALSVQASSQAIIGPLASALCRHFTVGSLCCDAPSRVEAWPDRLEYYCKHQKQGKVHMVMYYRDIGCIRVHKSKLLFKIVTQLNMFTAYYDPANSGHMLSIAFDSRKELQKFHTLLQSAASNSCLDN